MVTVHLLNAAGLLEPQDAAAVLAATEQTSQEVAQELGLLAVDVVICEYPRLPIEELGVGGYAPGAHTAFLAIEPRNPNFSAWRTWLPMCASHELHHVARWQGPGYGPTLLDSLVSEGTATLYEASRFNTAPLYTKPVGDPRELWETAEPLLQSTDQHGRWFFGYHDLPRWAGYYLGYELARRFCAATGTSPADAARIEAEAFLTAAW